MIKIQKKNFNIDKEINFIIKKYQNVGAVSTFVGYVRDNNKNKKVISIKLEVYPEMAKKYLNNIVKKIKKNLNIQDILIIHRFGNLKIGEKIVLVAVFSKHRNEGIKGCKLIMDYLKKDAPFWKKEKYTNKAEWIQFYKEDFTKSLKSFINLKVVVDSPTRNSFLSIRLIGVSSAAVPVKKASS